MENWPAPVTERVMGFMSTRDICSLARTSKKMNSSCSGNEFWRQLYSTTFHVPVATLPAQPQQGTGAGAASWKAAFLRQHALLRHVDACRRKVVPRDGWTDLESLIAEAVGLELDDVLQHALVAVSKRAAGQEAPIRRAAVRALITAAAKNKPSMLQKLIALFPNSPAFHDEDGTTALHSATSREIALMLLKGGASPLAVISGSFAAPIHTAAAAGNVEVVRCLLDSASINLKTSSGDTALNVACFHGSLAVVRLLANVGADLKLANNEGMLPLHCAAANNHVEVVRYLLSRGCQPGVADNHGNSPMDLCAARNHLSLIELFLEKANSFVFVLESTPFPPNPSPSLSTPTDSRRFFSEQSSSLPRKSSLSRWRKSDRVRSGTFSGRRSMERPSRSNKSVRRRSSKPERPQSGFARSSSSKWL